MIYHATYDADSREEAEAFAFNGDAWKTQFPDKPISYILNATYVTLNGKDLPEYDTPAPKYRITFLFDNADDAVLFKLRYNHDQSSS